MEIDAKLVTVKVETDDTPEQKMDVGIKDCDKKPGIVDVAKTSFQGAKNCVSDAELTSNLESDVKDRRSRRKRRKRVIHLPGESSDEENYEHVFNDYPVPPVLKSSQSHQVENSVSEDTGASLVESLDVSGPSQQNEGIFETLTPLETSEHAISANLDQLQNSVREIENNQKSLWAFNSDILLILSRIEAKIDLLLMKNGKNSASTDSLNDKELCLLSALPVNAAGFNELNDLLNQSQSFRHKCKKMLLATGGRNARVLACNLLKKILTDDIADVYSLTGKSASAQKQAFDKTGVYKIIMEACIHVYGNSQERTIREAISDWLMQAKFRKSRREQRKRASANLPDPL